MHKLPKLLCYLEEDGICLYLASSENHFMRFADFLEGFYTIFSIISNHEGCVTIRVIGKVCVLHYKKHVTNDDIE